METKKNSAIDLVNACGDFAHAVDAVMGLTRALWHVALYAEHEVPTTYLIGKEYRVVHREDLLRLLPSPTVDVIDLILKTLSEKTRKRPLVKFEEHRIQFTVELLRQFALVRNTLEGLKPDQDLRYFVMRNIRKYHKFPLTSSTVHLLHVLASRVNASYKSGGPQGIPYAGDFLPQLHDAISESQRTNSEGIIDLFVECSRELGFLRAAYFKPKCIDLTTTFFDATYLISNLYGMPTGIPGFDELFGGGIMFAEDLPTQTDTAIGGRTTLIRGQFGTGKSLLSMQLAAEVARKGGLAWLMPLEQSAEECLYALESINALPSDNSVVIASDSSDAQKILKNSDGRGALIILKTVKDSFDDFLVALAENADRMRGYNLRLLIVDPINSIHISDDSQAQLRARMLKTLDIIERSGTNVMLVAEEGNEPENDLLFEQNIADTVIRLSVTKQHGYASRIFEILKSRLQREQRGDHPFSIVSGVGIRIYPSSASVNARIRPRRIREKKTDVKFGLHSLDHLLGEKAITAGDVIVFQGAEGSYKTQLGLLFLLGADWTGDRSLLVSARDDEATIHYMLEQDFIRRFQGRKNRTDIAICELPRGHVYPGLVIQRIENELLALQLEGHWVDRVMIDNIAHWEMSSPFIREDETFGDTLLDLLRRQRSTSLFICGEVGGGDTSVVQRSIIDGADCVIKFERFEFRGVRRVMIRVLKTRGMNHRREAFELSLTPDGLEVKPSSSLLRLGRGGETTSVNVRLFFQSNNSIQQRYNNRLIEGIRSVLTEQAQLDDKDRIHVGSSKSLAVSSAIDELQVIQLDEYQLPSVSEFVRQKLLYKFSETQWDSEIWDDFLNRFLARIRNSSGHFFAVPYYSNLSLLAYRRDGLDDTPKTWQELADICEEWERTNTGSTQLFFDFPKASTEHYNCLFFEILLTLQDLPETLDRCNLREWLRSAAAVEASSIYRRLCRRAYIASGRSDVFTDRDRSESVYEEVNQNALVWRHWYSTLNQMLSRMSFRDRESINVDALPGNKSISGEWFCGVTSYSAAPDVGLEIIKLITNRESELDRLQAGVGLPTRAKFFDSENHSNDSNGFVSPFFQMNTGKLKLLLETSFRRSQIGCYPQFSSVLAFHLQRIIDISDGPPMEIEDKIRGILRSLETRIDFMQAPSTCEKCELKKRFKN